MTQLYTILMFTKYHFFRWCVPTSSTPSNLISVLLSNKKWMLLVWTSSACLPRWTIFKNHYIHLISTVLSYTLCIRLSPLSLRQLFTAIRYDSRQWRFSLFFSLLSSLLKTKHKNKNSRTMRTCMWARQRTRE